MTNAGERKWTQEEKDQLFLDVAEKVARTLSKKNADYGDSFHDVYAKFGDTSSYIRLSDKLGRLENAVLGKDLKVTEETVEDIFWDIAGYAILTLSSKHRLKQMEEGK